MIIVAFFLLTLMPILLVFCKWVVIHRRGTTQLRVRSKEYYDAQSAINVAKFQFQNNYVGSPIWALTNTYSATLASSGTAVTIDMTNEGTP